MTEVPPREVKHAAISRADDRLWRNQTIVVRGASEKLKNESYPCPLRPFVHPYREEHISCI